MERRSENAVPINLQLELTCERLIKIKSSRVGTSKRLETTRAKLQEQKRQDWFKAFRKDYIGQRGGRGEEPEDNTRPEKIPSKAHAQHEEVWLHPNIRKLL